MSERVSRRLSDPVAMGDRLVETVEYDSPIKARVLRPILIGKHEDYFKAVAVMVGEPVGFVDKMAAADFMGLVALINEQVPDFKRGGQESDSSPELSGGPQTSSGT